MSQSPVAEAGCCHECYLSTAAFEIRQTLGVNLTLTSGQLLQYIAARDYDATLVFVDERLPSWGEVSGLALDVYFPERPDCDHGDIELVMSNN